jgi:hypothetical protein
MVSTDCKLRFLVYQSRCSKMAKSWNEEAAALAALQEWQTVVSTNTVGAALGELKVWLNLPQNLLDLVHIHHIRTVIRRLSERCR